MDGDRKQMRRELDSSCRLARPMRAMAATLALAVSACSSTPDADPRYAPAENVLEVVAVLRRHVPDDTYRFEPARDFTGRNVYRSSLLRLESLQRVHASALRAGHMDGVIAFAKGRAMERLRAFDLAAGEYQLAAEREPDLAAEALRSADVCLALDRTSRVGVEYESPEETAGAAPPTAAPDDVIEAYEQRAGRLEELAAVNAGSHYEFVVREEVERADVARARYFTSLRRAWNDGDLRAIAELQRVVSRHRNSKKVSRHMLNLADLYRDLAAEYVEANPPAGLRFDPVRFQELVDSAAQLYEVVAARDGTVEKLEASRQLEAFLAFAIQIDNDRFTP